MVCLAPRKGDVTVMLLTAEESISIHPLHWLRHRVNSNMACTWRLSEVPWGDGMWVKGGQGEGENEVLLFPSLGHEIL